MRAPGAVAVAPQSVRVESDALYCSGVQEDGPLAELPDGERADWCHVGPAVGVVGATMAENIVGISNPKRATVPSTVASRRLVFVIPASCTMGLPRGARRA